MEMELDEGQNCKIMKKKKKRKSRERCGGRHPGNDGKSPSRNFRLR